jgi:hypothetical protein
LAPPDAKRIKLSGPLERCDAIRLNLVEPTGVVYDDHHINR